MGNALSLLIWAASLPVPQEFSPASGVGESEEVGQVLRALRQHSDSYEPVQLDFVKEVYETVEYVRVDGQEHKRDADGEKRPGSLSASLSELKKGRHGSRQVQRLPEPRRIAVNRYRQYLEGRKYRHDVEWTGKDPVSPGRTGGTRIRAFDGEYLRTIESFPQGSLGTLRSTQRGAAADPEFKFTTVLTTNVVGEPIVDFLDRCAAKGLLRIGTLQEASMPGDVYVEALFSRGGMGARVIVDSQRDFFPVEITHFRGANRHFRIVSDELFLTTTGQWFPSKVTCEVFDPVGSADGEKQDDALVLLERITVDPNSIRIGTDIPDEIFRLEFPAGTTVQDDVANATYVVGTPQIESLVEGTRKFFGGRADADLSSEASSPGSILIFIVAPCVLVGLLILLWRRHVTVKQSAGPR